jgi:MYXO-CTERM domain-containing protein
VLVRVDGEPIAELAVVAGQFKTRQEIGELWGQGVLEVIQVFGDGASLPTRYLLGETGKGDALVPGSIGDEAMGGCAVERGTRGGAVLLLVALGLVVSRRRRKEASRSA